VSESPMYEDHFEVPIRTAADPPDKIKALLKNDQDTLTLYETAMVGKHGGDRKSEAAWIKNDNVTVDPGPFGALADQNWFH
jgi:hypothetical protein